MGPPYRVFRQEKHQKSFYSDLSYLVVTIKEMGEVDANKDKVTRHDLRHDKHTVSLLTDHLVFSPKYRGKVLLGDVAEVAEEIIRETCKELDIEVIDMAVNIDH